MADHKEISKQGIARATIVLVCATLLSRVFGFFREVVIADQFGASATTDAFFVALTIPVLFADFIKYSVKNSFVPVFSRYRMKYGDPASWRFAWRITRLLTIGLVAVSLGLFFGSSEVISAIAPGLSDSARTLSVQLMRAFSFLVILLGLAAMLESIYNGFEHFIIPAFAPLAMNVSVITAVVLLSKQIGAKGIAVGFLAGGILQVIILSRIFGLGRFTLKGRLEASQKELKKVFNLGFFIALVQGIWGLYYVLDRFLASALADGSISALAFADRLIQLPLGVFVLAISIATLPGLSQAAARKDQERVERICSVSLRLLLFVIIPITVFLCITRYPLIRMIYQRGSFDALATSLTAGPLLAFALGLGAFAAQIFILRVYFALQDVRTPVVTSGVSFLLKIVLSLLLYRSIGATGIALATSLAALCNAFLLGALLKKRGYISTVFGPWSGLDKLIIGWILLSISTLAAFRLLGRLALGDAFLGDAVQVVGAVFTGGTVYLAATVLLRTEEIDRLKGALGIRSPARP